MTTYLFMRVHFPSGEAFGPSRAAILEGIDRFGSMAASARAVGLTYRQVWATVKVLNRIFPRPLVDVRVGGRASGASLTALGKELLVQFRTMELVANKALESHFRAMEDLLGEDPEAPASPPRWVLLRDAAEERTTKESPEK